MSNLLDVFAVVILLAWVIGLFAYNAGGIVHILLVIAIIAFLLRAISGRVAFLYKYSNTTSDLKKH